MDVTPDPTPTPQEPTAPASQFKALHVASCDLNGLPRGKRYPGAALSKVQEGAVRFPLSVMNLDLWGDDIEDSPLVLASGDRDGVLTPTGRGPVPVPWLDTPTAIVPLWMSKEDGTPFAGDPRRALDRVLARYRALDWHPIVAVELEFTLIDLADDDPMPPRDPLTGRRAAGGEILSLNTVADFDTFLTELYDGCETMGIPADSLISESGLGQFEMTLSHGADALRAIDDAWLFKLLVKRLAERHGMTATFMAKPYAEWSGNGMHMHASVLDAAGRNVFDNGGVAGSNTLRHAIAGCLKALAPSTALFAPHPTSYTRFVPGAHAPTGICWGYENRTAAIRVPGGSPKARRLEHRVAGGDVNPYLSAAAILGAMMNGIEDQTEPPSPIKGNAYAQPLAQVPNTLPDALALFEQSPEIARIFEPEMRDAFLRTKRQELARASKLTPNALHAFHIDTL